MPAKSIISVDVDDAAFKQFNKLFQQYQTALKSTPLAWRNIAAAQQQGVKGFRDLVMEQAAAISQQRLLNEAHKAAINLLRQEDSSWERIKRNTTGAATNIRDMTTQLLKWSSLTAVFSGLVGAGGLFGISRLTESVASGRRSSLGLGATYGQRRAFGTAFDRFVDPGSVLSGVEGALTDVTRRVSLYNAGLTDRDLTGGSAAVSARLLVAAKRLADRTPDQLLGTVFETRNLGNVGLSIDAFRRLKRSSWGEVEQQEAAFGRYSRAYGIGTKEQRDYQNFLTSLHDAGNRIETVFVRGLAPLIPSLEQLSRATVKSVQTLLAAPELKQGIKELSAGIEGLSKYISTPQFQGGLKEFAHGIVVIGGEFARIVRWFGASEKDIKKPVTFGDIRRGAATHGATGLGLAAGAVELWQRWKGEVPSLPVGQTITQSRLLGLVRKLEGSGDHAISPAGAIGRYQITPDTARTYGFDPSRLMDPTYNEKAARKILQALSRKYHGDLDEILTAYNAGPGVANRFRRSGDNIGVIPRETQKYLDHAHRIQGVHVTVTNRTGGDVVVSAQQVTVP